MILSEKLQFETGGNWRTGLLAASPWRAIRPRPICKMQRKFKGGGREAYITCNLDLIAQGQVGCAARPDAQDAAAKLLLHSVVLRMDALSVLCFGHSPTKREVFESFHPVEVAFYRIFHLLKTLPLFRFQVRKLWLILNLSSNHFNSAYSGFDHVVQMIGFVHWFIYTWSI